MKGFATKDSKKFSVRGELFKDKAKSISKHFKDKNTFNTNDGCLQNFKSRLGIRRPIQNQTLLINNDT